MSNSSGDLLRMLMPAVSPVPTSSAPRPDSKLPIESRSFESLLAEAREGDASAPIESAEPTDTTDSTGSSEGVKPDTPSNTMPGLTGISSIHNASLRQLIAGDVQP